MMESHQLQSLGAETLQSSAVSNPDRHGYPALSWVQYAYPFDYDLLAEKIVEKLRGSDPRIDRLKKQIW